MHLLRSAYQKGKNPYANYYEKFVEDANSIMMKGTVKPKDIRDGLSKAWANKKQELQEYYKNELKQPGRVLSVKEKSNSSHDSLSGRIKSNCEG